MNSSRRRRTSGIAASFDMLARIRLNAVFGSMQMVALFHCTHQPKLHGLPPAEHSLLFAYYPKPQLLEGERILK